MSARKKKKTSEDAATFEEQMTRLDAIAGELESGELGLEKAIARYEEGVKCYRECHRILSSAEKKVEMLTRTASGEVTTVPFETEDADADATDDDADAADDEDDTGTSLF